jgi:hypothetical protein
MLGLLENFGFPPHPAGVGFIILCSLIWGLRSRRKNRTYPLAMQAAIVAAFLTGLTIAIQSDSFSFSTVLGEITSLTIGQFIMFWFFCWLIVSLIFTIRARNDAANIFTRNRKK